MQTWRRDRSVNRVCRDCDRCGRVHLLLFTARIRWVRRRARAGRGALPRIELVPQLAEVEAEGHFGPAVGEVVDLARARVFDGAVDGGADALVVLGGVAEGDLGRQREFFDSRAELVAGGALRGAG